MNHVVFEQFDKKFSDINVGKSKEILFLLRDGRVLSNHAQGVALPTLWHTLQTVEQRTGDILHNVSQCTQLKNAPGTSYTMFHTAYS